MTRSIQLGFPFTNEDGKWTGTGAFLTCKFKRSLYIYSLTVPYDETYVLYQLQQKGLKGYCVDNLTERESNAIHAALMFGDEKCIVIGKDTPFHYTRIGGYLGAPYPGKNNILAHLVNRVDHIRLDCEEIYKRRISPVKEEYQKDKEDFHKTLLYEDLKPYWDSSSIVADFNIEHVFCSRLENNVVSFRTIHSYLV